MAGFSERQRGKKLAGVASTFGEVFNMDPTFIRIAFVATFLLVSWEVAVLAYLAGGIYLHMAKRAALKRGDANGSLRSDPLERSGPAPRASVHDLLTKLDANDRRMMAIDHHLNSAKNDELARSIEALREKDHA